MKCCKKKENSPLMGGRHLRKPRVQFAESIRLSGPQSIELRRMMNVGLPGKRNAQVSGLTGFTVIIHLVLCTCIYYYTYNAFVGCIYRDLIIKLTIWQMSYIFVIHLCFGVFCFCFAL